MAFGADPHSRVGGSPAMVNASPVGYAHRFIFPGRKNRRA